MRSGLPILTVALAGWYVGATAPLESAEASETVLADRVGAPTARCEPAILGMYYSWQHPPDLGDVLLVRATSDSIPDALTSVDLHGLYRDTPLPAGVEGVWYGQTAVVERVTPHARGSIHPGDTISLLTWTMEGGDCGLGGPVRPATQLAEGHYVVPVMMSPRGLDGRVIDTPRPWSPFPDGWNEWPPHPPDTPMMSPVDFFDLIVALRAPSPRTTRGAFIEWAREHPELVTRHPARDFAAWWLDR